MSIISRTDIPLKPMELGERTAIPSVVYQLLDADAFVAVSFTSKTTIDNTVSCQIGCWLVDEDGDPRMLRQDLTAPLALDFKHNASAEQINRIGIQAIASSMLNLLLGEPVEISPVIAWPDNLRESMNIRNAITAVTAISTPIDLVLL